MKIQLLDLLRCPFSGQTLHFSSGSLIENNEIIQGHLCSEDEQYQYPIIKGIPRFVDNINYADNFGLQWNIFSKTQLDSYSGYPISYDRFWNATNWSPENIINKWVLDVGCGAGRFAEIALNAGAKVVALDYSSAIDACYANLKQHPNFHVVQGDIYSLPFKKESFHFVYSLGVLQHTPNVRKAFFMLPPFVKKKGKLCVDYYSKSWKSSLLPKYWLRPITKLLKKPTLFSLLKVLVIILFPLSWFIGKLPGGYLFKRAIPVADPLYYYELENDGLKISYQKHVEWALLDTFDWLSPTYDNPQTENNVYLWMETAGINNIEVLKAGHLVARGTK